MKTVAFCAAALLALAGCSDGESGPATNSIDTLDRRLDAILDPLEADGLNGVILIQHGNDILYERALGHADCAGTRPMSIDSVISIGSIVKDMLNIVAFALDDEGVLLLNDPAGRWIDDWPPEKSAITIEQLVTHTSGLPDTVGSGGAPVDYTPDYDFEKTSRDDMIDRARKSSLVFEPGTDEAYSNLGYALLAAIMEKAAGEPIESILKQKIFDPAGMAHTGYVLPDWPSGAFAEGCYKDGSRWGSPLPDGRWMEDGPGWNLRGNGGVYSTAPDMAAFMDGLASGVFLSRKAEAAWREERLVYIKSMSARGMGPAGGNGITNAIIFWLEGEDLRVVIMTTSEKHQAEDFSSGVIRAAASSL